MFRTASFFSFVYSFTHKLGYSSFISILISGKSARYVSCGSVIKLMNSATKVRLHSHDVKYGTGSGQQSVTGVEDKDDGNSHWIVKAESGKECTRG